MSALLRKIKISVRLETSDCHRCSLYLLSENLMLYSVQTAQMTQTCLGATVSSGRLTKLDGIPDDYDF